MKILILFLVVSMLAGCGRKSIVGPDIEGQDVHITQQPQQTEEKTEEEVADLEDSGTGVNELGDYNPFKVDGEPRAKNSIPDYYFPLGAIFIGSGVYVAGRKHHDYKSLFGGLAIAGLGVLCGIKMVHNCITE